MRAMNFWNVIFLLPIVYLYSPYNYHIEKSNTKWLETFRSDFSNKEWLFLICTGRSGSTTLLNMVNLISPQLYIRGELQSLTNKLLTIHDSIVKIPYRENGAYYSKFRVEYDEMYPEYRKILYKTLGHMYDKNINTVGFKLVSVKTEKQLNWLNTLFPNARFIVNWRKNTTEQKKSMVRSKFNAPKHSDPKKWNEQIQSWSMKQHPDRIFELPLEEFSVDNFNRLLEWLDYDGCKFLRVVHNNKKTLNFESTLKVIDGLCIKK